MPYKIWRSSTEVSIEAGDNRIVFPVSDISSLCRDLMMGTDVDPRNLSPTARKTRFTKLWNSGVKTADIAKAMGVAPSSVSPMRLQYGLKPRREMLPHVLAALQSGRARHLKRVK